MRVLYNFSIYTYVFIIRIVGFFDEKVNKWVKGRIKVFDKIEESLKTCDAPLVWFHAASLGEFEQGKPVIERFKQEFSHYKIFLTFFSPSGYEIQKNYEGADYIFYLPADTQKNARRFVQMLQPKAAFFIKYEFWRNYFEALKEINTPIISFSTIFRTKQIYFRSNGFNRKTLSYVDLFFVQNESSGKLLSSIGIDNWEVTGDTRFDRVMELHKSPQPFPEIEKFKGDSRIMVIGSSWKEDMEVLLPIINSFDLKFIIAPHEIHVREIEDYQLKIQPDSVRYSLIDEASDKTRVIFIDSMGILSSLYHYADFAYIGGAFGKGLHNTLEAAVNGIPIFFGPRYDRFQEAIGLVECGGAYSIDSSEELAAKLQQLMTDEDLYSNIVSSTSDFVVSNIGATDRIIKYCKTQLDLQ